MLNEKAQAIYDYILRYAGERGYPPTIREIGEEFGISSTNGVRHYLTVLERKGYVRRDKRISRGLELLEPTSAGRVRTAGAVAAAGAVLDRAARGIVSPLHAGRAVSAPQGIPILGRVAAGTPTLAEENVEGHLTLDEVFPAREETFALRVRGHSMRDKGILDGDVVVVRQQDHARDGDTVVALVDDDATVKTYRRTAEGVDLVPGNPEFEVKHVTGKEDFRILGVVLGLVRPPPGIRRS